MTRDTSLPIVVGVDGSEEGGRAVRYAVIEARKRGCGILLVHAVHATAPMAARPPQSSLDTLTGVGMRIVGDAQRLARDIDPEVVVNALVTVGRRGAVLVNAGENAQLIVLGHRSRHNGRVITSSTTAGTAARAQCPVISVPDTWIPGHEHGRVVAGVDESEACHDVLDLAFQEARLRHARLIVLHAWRLPAACDDISPTQGLVDEWMAAARDQLQMIVEPFRALYPEVVVETILRHQFASVALVAACETADLMVIGRNGLGPAPGVYVGSLARMLIREGRCPVEIAPTRARPDPPVEEWLLSEDEVQSRG